MTRWTCWPGLLAASLIAAPTFGQRSQPARIELPRGFQPRHPEGGGLRILIDEAHNNLHDAGGTYAPFAWLASRDGHLIGRNTSAFPSDALERAQVLVIANARRPRGVRSGQAMTPAEIEALIAWIERGGALLLVIDHVPFPAFVASLSDRLGVRVLGDTAKRSEAPDIFEARRGNIPRNEINCDGSIRQVRSFRGSALAGPEGSFPLLLLDDSWDIGEQPAPAGAAQAIAFRRGSGRVIVAGEAAMFTAQVTGEDRRLAGIGAEGSRDNVRFVLAALQWLGAPQPCPPSAAGGGND